MSLTGYNQHLCSFDFQYLGIGFIYMYLNLLYDYIKLLYGCIIYIYVIYCFIIYNKFSTKVKTGTVLHPGLWCVEIVRRGSCFYRLLWCKNTKMQCVEAWTEEHMEHSKCWAELGGGCIGVHYWFFKLCCMPEIFYFKKCWKRNLYVCKVRSTNSVFPFI